jgi:hypothetical protein
MPPIKAPRSALVQRSRPTNKAHLRAVVKSIVGMAAIEQIYEGVNLPPGAGRLIVRHGATPLPLRDNFKAWLGELAGTFAAIG